MSRKLCAVVGIGHRSHSWIPQIVTTYKEQAELIALCDPVIARCHDANEYFGASAACYDNYGKMLKEVKPDLVIVVSPEHVHTEHIVKALDAGCEVATEKPLCTKAEEAVRRKGSDPFK